MSKTASTPPPPMRKVLAALDRLYAEKEAERFPAVMMAVAEELVPCVNASFDAIELETNKVSNFFSREPGLPREEFMKRWSAMCHEHPGIQHLERGGTAEVMEIQDFLTQRQFQKTAIYNEVFVPCGGGYEIGVILPVPGFVVGMAINRERPFRPQERQFIEMLHPHFVRAFQNAQLFTSLRGSAEMDYRNWRNQGLTRRESEVLRWLIDGKRDGEIALILGAAPRTVSKHVENILRKLNVESRTAAAAEARRLMEGTFFLPKPADGGKPQ